MGDRHQRLTRRRATTRSCNTQHCHSPSHLLSCCTNLRCAWWHSHTTIVGVPPRHMCWPTYTAHDIAWDIAADIASSIAERRQAAWRKFAIRSALAGQTPFSRPPLTAKRFRGPAGFTARFPSSQASRPGGGVVSCCIAYRALCRTVCRAVPCRGSGRGCRDVRGRRR